MSTIKDYKFIRQKNKNLVNGYIREIQALFSTKVTYFMIPPSINRLCVLYYTIRGEFIKSLCSKHLKFIDEKTVAKINKAGHALCLFGEAITDSMCNIFRIEFTLRKSGECNYFCPYYGFAASSSISDLMGRLKTIKDWNANYVKFNLNDGKTYPGYSISMNRISGQFRWNGSSVINEEKIKMDVNDTFMFVHRFDTSQCIAYHNNKQIHQFQLPSKCIIPTLSLYYRYEEIEVTKYEFE